MEKYILCSSRVGNGNLHINTRLNADVSDLSNNLSRGVKVEDSLVNSHLPSVEGVGTLTARGFADAKSKELGRHTDRARNLQVLTESLVLKLSTDLLQSFNLTGSKGDADLVDLDFFGFNGLWLS